MTSVIIVDIFGDLQPDFFSLFITGGGNLNVSFHFNLGGVADELESTKKLCLVSWGLSIHAKSLLFVSSD